MRKFKFSYDKYTDDLFLHRANTKSKGSVELGDLIFDYNSKKELVGMQIINASKMIKDLVGGDKATIKEVLDNLNECKLDIKKKNNLLIIKIRLSSKLKEIQPTLSVPSIIESSPALAYT